MRIVRARRICGTFDAGPIVRPGVATESRRGPLPEDERPGTNVRPPRRSGAVFRPRPRTEPSRARVSPSRGARKTCTRLIRLMRRARLAMPGSGCAVARRPRRREPHCRWAGVVVIGGCLVGAVFARHLLRDHRDRAFRGWAGGWRGTALLVRSRETDDPPGIAIRVLA